MTITITIAVVVAVIAAVVPTGAQVRKWTIAGWRGVERRGMVQSEIAWNGSYALASQTMGIGITGNVSKITYWAGGMACGGMGDRIG